VLHFSPGLVDNQYLLPLWLCLFCIPLLALIDLNEGISRAHGWMNTALAPTYLLRPLLLIAGAFTAVQLGAKLDAALVMALAILASLLTVLAQSTVMLIRLKRLGVIGRMAGTPSKWILASLPIVMAQTFELITQNFDMIAVSYFLGPESTGIYFAALKTIALLAFVNFAVGAATANQIASLHVNGAAGEFRSALDGAVNLTFWPSLLGAVALVMLAPHLLSLFGGDFKAHAYLTIILALGFVAKSFVGPAELYLNVLGHQKICALVLLVAAMINMMLNILLIPMMGLSGAAIATSVSLIVLSISLFVIAYKKLGVRLRPTIPTTSLRMLASLLRPSKR
jgi:O-antigen/teichoic acid export membrane protein